MDTGKRHETPGSKTGLHYSWFSKQHEHRQHIALLLCPQTLPGQCDRPHMIFTVSWGLAFLASPDVML